MVFLRGAGCLYFASSAGEAAVSEELHVAVACLVNRDGFCVNFGISGYVFFAGRVCFAVYVCYGEAFSLFGERVVVACVV